MTIMKHCTFWLVFDVWCGFCSAPCSGHDVTGQDINLDFLAAHVGSAIDSP